jgi:hypothetical protein
MEWEKAADMWSKHGEAYGLSMPTDRYVALKTIAGDVQTLPPEPTPEQLNDPAFAKRYRAMAAIYFYHSHRNVTNFAYFQAAAQAEAQPKTIEARKILWQASQARQAGNKLQAIALYKDGLERWKGVLTDNPNYHRNDRTDRAEEEAYEYEIEYLRLIAQDDRAVRVRAQEEYDKVAQGLRAVMPFMPISNEIPETLKLDLYAEAAEKFFSPFAGNARDGLPWIRNDTKETVRSRSGGRVAQPPGAGGPTGQ